jgi:glycosyltransferase involved in cell wall biosynthesis
MLPLISICIPNYNKASFIAETIDSVYRQTYPNIELIIVDDCSIDNSVEVINHKIKDAPFKTTFLQNNLNSGICYSLNKAIRTATGKYYQMIGSDDLILPHKIANQVTVFEKLPADYAIVFGKSYRIDILGNYLEKDYYESIDVDPSLLKTVGFEDLLLKNFISSSSHLVRMSAIMEVGMYDESLRAEDWDMWLRLSKIFKILFINEYNSVYRIVPSSLSNNSKNFATVYAAYSKTLLKHLNYSFIGNRNIAKNIESFSLTVYKYDGEDAKELLKKNLQLNKNLKSLILFISAQLGIKYSYYETLKFRKRSD